MRIEASTSETQQDEALGGLFGAEEEEAAPDPIVVGAETYRRCVESPPKEVVMDLAGERHSLWGHRLWNAARVLSDMFDRDPSLCNGKAVLELGAGAGLPSLICALNGARRAVISDYQNPGGDDVLVRAIQNNIDRLSPVYVARGVMHAVGYVWGQDPQPLLEPLQDVQHQGLTERRLFDVLILADLLFNRTQHDKLLWTCRRCMADSGTAWVAFSHHDPRKAELDLAFFRKAGEPPYEFVVSKVGQEQMQDLFVENDGLDELRGIVYVYKLKNKSSDSVPSR